MPNIFVINPNSHFMQPGSVDFVPAWVILFIAILTFSLFYPKFFKTKKADYLNPLFVALIIGALMPSLDDLAAFVVGPPFAHHSLFHSVFGPILTYIGFRIIANKKIAKYAMFGNITHSGFNFFFDYVAIFFPFTYREFGVASFLPISTYGLKAIFYPIIFVLFPISIYKYFYAQK